MLFNKAKEEKESDIQKDIRPFVVNEKSLSMLITLIFKRLNEQKVHIFSMTRDLNIELEALIVFQEVLGKEIDCLQNFMNLFEELQKAEEEIIKTSTKITEISLSNKDTALLIGLITKKKDDVKNQLMLWESLNISSYTKEEIDIHMRKREETYHELLHLETMQIKLQMFYVNDVRL